MTYTPYIGFGLRAPNSNNSDDPVARLKRLIGFSEEPVQDAQGYWTIGYGERLNDKPGGPKPYATISEPMADEALRYRFSQDPSQFGPLESGLLSPNHLQRLQLARETHPMNGGQSASELQNGETPEMKPYEPSSATVLPGQMIEMFTFGGFDIVGSEKEPTQSYLGGGPRRRPHLSVPNSVIVFKRTPQFSGDSTFGERITVVNGHKTYVATPSGHYFVSNVVPHGSENPGVSVTVSGR